MKSMTLHMLAQLEAQVIHALMYEGKIKAVKLYKEATGRSISDAKRAIEKIALSIKPGRATAGG